MWATWAKDPVLRGFSKLTGCHLYYTPPKCDTQIQVSCWKNKRESSRVGSLSSMAVRYLPKDVGQQYYGNKSAFTFLRDPPRACNSMQQL